MRTQTLRVPGATLYYEVRGSGPLLLMIVGGNGDAATFEGVADVLAESRTVVTYDRRGYSRSPLDTPGEGHRVGTDSDDVKRLLDEVADGPGDVLGSSSGAIVALDVLARYPDDVARVVSHEPPAVTLLPDAATHLAFLDEVHQIYQREGVDPAMRFFSAGVGLDHGLQPPEGVELPQHLLDTISRIQRNLVSWMDSELYAYPRFAPDIQALTAMSDRLILAGGLDSRKHFPYWPNTVLADRLGKDVIDFPGGHVGYMTHPAEFATQLRQILA